MCNSRLRVYSSTFRPSACENGGEQNTLSSYIVSKPLICSRLKSEAVLVDGSTKTRRKHVLQTIPVCEYRNGRHVQQGLRHGTITGCNDELSLNRCQELAKENKTVPSHKLVSKVNKYPIHRPRSGSHNSLRVFASPSTLCMRHWPSPRFIVKVVRASRP